MYDYLSTGEQQENCLRVCVCVCVCDLGKFVIRLSFHVSLPMNILLLGRQPLDVVVVFSNAKNTTRIS